MSTKNSVNPPAAGARRQWVKSEYFPCVQVGELLFLFTSEDDWVEHAQIRFRSVGHTPQTAICIDVDGHILTRGAHFKLASYPVKVYAIDDPAYPPSGMLARTSAPPPEDSPAHPAEAGESQKR
jgi:hypothetical protein